MSTAARATIASGDSQSSAIDVRDQKVVRVVTPAALDGVQITFLECVTIDGTFLPMLDDTGNEVGLTVVTGEAQSIGIPWDMLPGARFIKLRQGNKATPVNAAAARLFHVILVGGF